MTSSTGMTYSMQDDLSSSSPKLNKDEEMGDVITDHKTAVSQSYHCAQAPGGRPERTFVRGANWHCLTNLNVFITLRIGKGFDSKKSCHIFDYSIKKGFWVFYKSLSIGSF